MANTSTESCETRCSVWSIKDFVRDVLVCFKQLVHSIAFCWQEEIAINNDCQADLQRRYGREHFYLLAMF